jgi:hypothetical protein
MKSLSEFPFWANFRLRRGRVPGRAGDTYRMRLGTLKGVARAGTRQGVAQCGLMRRAGCRDDQLISRHDGCHNDDLTTTITYTYRFG